MGFEGLGIPRRQVNFRALLALRGNRFLSWAPTGLVDATHVLPRHVLTVLSFSLQDLHLRVKSVVPPAELLNQGRDGQRRIPEIRTPGGADFVLSLAVRTRVVAQVSPDDEKKKLQTPS